MYIVTIGNSKGGVGKSTITALLSTKLTSEGKRVLVIDCDYQESLAHHSKLNESKTLPDLKISTQNTETFKELLKESFDHYDYCFLDVQGAMSGDIHQLALKVSDFLIIPTGSSLVEIEQTVRYYNSIDVNHKKVLANKIKPRQKEFGWLKDLENLDMFKNHLNDRVAYQRAIDMEEAVDNEQFNNVYKEFLSYCNN